MIWQIFTIDKKRICDKIPSVDAGIAHPVERHLAKVEVASSSLVARSIQAHRSGGGPFFQAAASRCRRLRGSARWEGTGLFVLSADRTEPADSPDSGGVCSVPLPEGYGFPGNLLPKDICAPVAELADALDLGSSPKGCRFDSCRAHHVKTSIDRRPCFFFLLQSRAVGFAAAVPVAEK